MLGVYGTVDRSKALLASPLFDQFRYFMSGKLLSIQILQGYFINCDDETCTAIRVMYEVSSMRGGATYKGEIRW